MNSVRSVTRHRKMKKVQKRLYELPRKQHEVVINDYNPTLLLASKANMDLQFVTDDSEMVARYVTGYVTKGDRADVDQSFAELGHESLSKRLFAYRLKSLTNKSIGVYEALDMLTGQSLYNKSDSTRFINTNVKENRSKILKSFTELARLRETDPQSEDTCQKSFVDDKYPNRPDNLENVSLFHFGRFYDSIRYSEAAKKNQNVVELKQGLGLMRKRIKPYIIEHFIHDPEEEVEQYCHALLILFKPWRNERELLGEFASYAEAFKDSLSTLKSMKEYHEKLSVSKEVEKKRKALEKAKDQISNTADPESQDDENALQGREIVFEAENAMAEVQAAMDVNFDAVSNDNVALLNSDQKRIFDDVMNDFDQERVKPSCRFVSGPGGSGKSFLIDTTANAVRRLFKNAASVAIAAPTGLASIAVNGLTLHRLLMLPVDHAKIAEYHSLSSDNMSVMKETLGNLKLLIIDEISMVSSVMLAYIHLRLCEFWEMNEAFGGKVSILVFGDFLQLPPVKGNPAFLKLTAQEARNRLNSLGGGDLWRFFRYDELTQNVRQANDQKYAEILSRVRIGNITEADISTLQTRLVPGGKNTQTAIELFVKLCDDGFHPICLLPTLAMCKNFNDGMLGRSSAPLESIACVDRLADYGKKMNKNIIARLKMLDKEPAKTGGLETNLILRVGCQVMVRKNISFEEGIVNGTMGFVTGFRKDDAGKITGIMLKVDREKRDFLVEKITIKFLLMANVYIKRTQFPLILAYAITIHKSQGMSIECAIMDLGSNLFGPGMAYVGLSRVKSLAGLHLLQLDPNKIKADSRAIIEYNRLRRKYRPDLPLLKITESKENQSRKRQAPTVSRSLIEGEADGVGELAAKETPRKRKKVQESSDNFPLVGFGNADTKTCYANSVLQLLLLVPELREMLTTYDGPLENKNVLSCLINAISGILSSRADFTGAGLALRQALGAPFTDDAEQDACEFLIAVLSKLHEETETSYLGNAIKELFWSGSRNFTKCPNCQLERNSDNVEQSWVFTLPLPVRGVIDWKSLEKRMRISEWQCQICKHPLIQERDVLVSSKKYVFLWLPRDSFENGQQMKIRTKISRFDNQNVELNGKRFKTKAVIIHKGESINEGHYLNLVRKTNSWFEISDEIITKRERFVSNLTDVSVILLEKVSPF